MMWPMFLPQNARDSLLTEMAFCSLVYCDNELFNSISCVFVLWLSIME